MLSPGTQVPRSSRVCSEEQIPLHGTQMFPAAYFLTTFAVLFYNIILSLQSKED